MKLMHIFWNTDMRCRHVGLIKRMKMDKVAWSKMKQGDMLVFINGSKNKLMILTPTDEDKTLGILSSYYSPRGRIEPMALQYIPMAYNAGQINMDAATKEALLNNLLKGKRSRKEKDNGKKPTRQESVRHEARL